MGVYKPLQKLVRALQQEQWWSQKNTSPSGTRNDTVRSTAKSAFMKFIRRVQIDISAVEHRNISHHWLIIFYLFTGFYDSWCCSRKARRSESSYACRSQELGHSDSPLVDVRLVRLVRLSMFWDPKRNQLGPKPLQWSSIFWILSDP